MPRIVLVDESSAYRTGLRSFIKKSIQAAEVLEASSLSHAFSHIRTGEFIDLVLMDLALSRFHSIETLRKASSAPPATRWVILSVTEARTDILASLAAGFHGFISKFQSDEEILTAVEDVLSGRIYVPTYLAATSKIPAGEYRRHVISGSANTLRLTARQREVLSLIGQGLSNKEIGKALHITEATTKIHTAALLRALGVRNRAEAAFKAARFLDVINDDLILDLTPARAHN